MIGNYTRHHETLISLLLASFAGPEHGLGCMARTKRPPRSTQFNSMFTVAESVVLLVRRDLSVMLELMSGAPHVSSS